MSMEEAHKVKVWADVCRCHGDGRVVLEVHRQNMETVITVFTLDVALDLAQRILTEVETANDASAAVRRLLKLQ